MNTIYPEVNFWDNLIPIKGGLDGAQLAGWTPGPAVKSGLGCMLYADQMIPVGEGISLAADTTYWVVLNAPTGSFDWGWTADNTGNGVGFQVAWSQSDDAGGTWFTADDYPFRMSVSASASAVPKTRRRGRASPSICA